MRLYLKKTHHKNRFGVAQGEGFEFKPQYHKKKKKKPHTHIVIEVLG
jgi:hypothetical protein